MENQEIILHLLQWRIVDIIPHVPIIARQGFTAILVSPIQGTKFTNTNAPWWCLYQGNNLKIGNAQIGTRDDYIRLCEECHKYGIKVFQDIVIRHVASSDFDSTKPHHSVDQELLKYIINNGDCYDYKNRQEYTMKRCGMPMLNYFDKGLQKLYIEFLDDLVACGCDGFRLDQAKHYKLPEEGCDFFHIFDKYKDKFIFGEVIFEDKWLLDKYAKYMHVLTEGRPSDTSRLVAWFESHDSYLEFGWTRNMSDQMRINELRVLVQQCKYHSLYYARPYEELWKSKEIRDINIHK